MNSNQDNNNELYNLLREHPTNAVEERKYDLDSLLSAVNDKNIHAKVDFGAPAGKEAI